MENEPTQTLILDFSNLAIQSKTNKVRTDKFASSKYHSGRDKPVQTSQEDLIRKRLEIVQIIQEQTIKAQINQNNPHQPEQYKLTRTDPRLPEDLYFRIAQLRFRRLATYMHKPEEYTRNALILIHNIQPIQTGFHQIVLTDLHQYLLDVYNALTDFYWRKPDFTRTGNILYYIGNGTYQYNKAIPTRIRPKDIPIKSHPSQIHA
jgi:hypothetical protein